MLSKAFKTMAKTTTIGLVGSVASVIGAAKAGEIVFKKTGSFGASTAVSMGVGTAGICATGAGMLAVVDHDTQSYTEQDFRDLHRMSGGLRAIGDGAKAVTNVVNLSRCFGSR